MSRQQRTVGAILAVPLGDGTRTFALTLPEADFAFFDARTTEATPPTNLLLKAVLFRVAVHKSAWVFGRWPKVAKVAVPPELQQPEPKFIQDALNLGRFEVYVGGTTSPATREQCEGLERAVVWEPEHVEERIHSHYKGIPSIWTQSLQLR